MYGVLYYTYYKRIIKNEPPIRPATRAEWLAALDEFGWPTQLVETIAGPGHRTVAVVGGPHRNHDPEPEDIYEVLGAQGFSEEDVDDLLTSLEQMARGEEGQVVLYRPEEDKYDQPEQDAVSPRRGRGVGREGQVPGGGG